jgi:hypothetical protein
MRAAAQEKARGGGGYARQIPAAAPSAAACIQFPYAALAR